MTSSARWLVLNAESPVEKLDIGSPLCLDDRACNAIAGDPLRAVSLWQAIAVGNIPQKSLQKLERLSYQGRVGTIQTVYLGRHPTQAIATGEKEVCSRAWQPCG